MNDEEFAHWSYRLKSLDRDIPATKDLLQTVEGVAEVAKALGMSFADQWGEYAGALRESLSTMRYLHEEARYMVQLGEIQRATT